MRRLDLMHPLGALVVGAVAASSFVYMFTLTQNRWKIDDVLGVWPLHGLCGTWGGLAAGLFGSKALGDWVAWPSPASFWAPSWGWAGRCWGHRGLWCAQGNTGAAPVAEEEYDGADLSIHKISATPDREVSW